MELAAVPLLNLVTSDGRGRSLVAASPLKAGQIILQDSPILLYSAFPLLPPPSSSSTPNTYCTHCFKQTSTQQPTTIPCPTCSTSLFCSPACLSLSSSSSHSPWVCKSLTKLQDPSSSPLLNRDVELQVQARFLIAAYILAHVSPADFQTLMSLQGEPTSFFHLPEWKDSVFFLHSLVLSLFPPQSGGGNLYTVELTGALLAKDKINAFGIMEPFAPGKERSVRAFGIYPRASFFNHDCLPNACRFDYVDSGSGEGRANNTDIIIRMIHDVPEGREICLSYFPVNLKYSERQRRLKEDYGFVCECDRCKVEADWSDEEDEGLDEDEAGDEGEAAMEGDDDDDMEEDDDGSAAKSDNDFPHAYFFLNYMCTKENCWGTLAPLPPSGSTLSTTLECNVCGSLSDSKGLTDGNVAE